MNTLRTPASTLWTALFVLTAKFMRFVEFQLQLKTLITPQVTRCELLIQSYSLNFGADANE